MPEPTLEEKRFAPGCKIKVEGRPSALARAVDWLVAAQANDGGWGGARGLPPSIEETALESGAVAGHAADEVVERREEMKLRGGLDRIGAHLSRSLAFVSLGGAFLPRARTSSRRSFTAVSSCSSFLPGSRPVAATG